MFRTRPSRQQRLNAVQRSLRISQYEQKKERTKKIKSVYLIVFGVIGYLLYLCIFSSIFKLQYVNITGNDSIPESEIKDLVFKQFESHQAFFFPGDNYFIFSEKKLRQQLLDLYNLNKLSINRSDRNTLTINIEELPGRALWTTQGKTFLIDSNGIVIREVPNIDESLKSAPQVFDLSNTSANIRDHVIAEDLVNITLQTKQNISNFNVPSVSIDHFAVDGRDATYIKLVTPQNLEVHLSPKLSIDQQFLKLRSSLEANKIDLSKIQYINLRVEDQVIYK